MTGGEPREMCRIVRFSLTSANAQTLCEFYEQAFGFRYIARRRHAGTDFEQLMGVPAGATSFALMLGRQTMELMEFDARGCPYPAASTAADLNFQHLALVVANMETAYQRLLEVPGWTPISTRGPEVLPETSGSVTAFKFRDPEGHPLELLAFPGMSTPAQWQGRAHNDLFLGIDHSAISISDTVGSLTFYRRLGLHVSAQTLNVGVEQQCLDALDRPDVKVTALASPGDGLHLELLCYLNRTRGTAPVLRNNDVAATRTVIEIAPAQAASAASCASCLRDPDGHHVELIRCAADRNL
jgi:catechol 2,3-dioxygenase-like lactoylglutathione lyase family enzyme